MDGQNFENGQNTEQPTASNNYQDNTSTYTSTYQDNTSAYTSNAYSSTPVESEAGTPGLAIGALVVSIIGIVTGCCGCLGTIFGIAGLVMAIVSNNKQKSGVGTAALVCSIIAIVLGLIMGILNVVVMMSA